MNEHSNHNLDIENYSLYELLDLFQLDINHITPEKMKKARNKVLYMHPDKSKLPKEYFLFYKKAFEVIVRTFESQTKVNQNVPKNEEILYTPDTPYVQLDKKQVQKTIHTMKPAQFNDKFNELFESHAQLKRNNEQKNEWFHQHDEQTNDMHQVKNKTDMDAAFEQYKQKQHAIVRYTGVVPLMNNGGSSGLYDEDDEDDQNYISADIFSKLKFDDLRKVHKDQTVFNISEQQFNSVPQYRSVDHYVRSREQQSHEPMQKQVAEQQLQTQRQTHEQRIQQKQYHSQIQSAQAQERSQQMLSNFLRIGT
jgi:hypothetical protein